MTSPTATSSWAHVPRWRSALLRPDLWKTNILLIALVLSLPILTVFSFLLHPAGEVWEHLVATVLRDYVTNSFILGFGVTVGTLAIGVPAAWLTSVCEFPGRRTFVWALLLPLALPAYIIAYTYTGMFDYAGPVQTGLRELFGWSQGTYWFPEVRSRSGAVAMLSLVLYPYVYLLARAAFIEQSSSLLDASRTLGYTPWRGFLRISLPIARPAIIAGVSLALMETLADYGTVQYFGVATFTTGIFRIWFGLGDSAAAAQLSALLMGFVFVLVIVERWSRHSARYHQIGSQNRPMQPFQLNGRRAGLAFLACLIPVFFGFLLPVSQLLLWAARTADEMVGREFVRLALNSIGLATVTALLALIFALFMGYGKRLRPTAAPKFAVRVAGMGYAVPGTVIAVGVLIPFAWLDNSIDTFVRNHFGFSTGLILSGTLAALIFAYLVRFLAVSLQTVESGLANVSQSMDDSARTLGYTPARVLWRVHVPMLRNSLITALLLVFVDVMKELPATLVLRPFNFNTLAVRAYELASDERLADSSSAALAIVVVGVIPVILMSRLIEKRSRIQRTVTQFARRPQ